MMKMKVKRPLFFQSLISISFMASTVFAAGPSPSARGGTASGNELETDIPVLTGFQISSRSGYDPNVAFQRYQAAREADRRLTAQIQQREHFANPANGYPYHERQDHARTIRDLTATRDRMRGSIAEYERAYPQFIRASEQFDAYRDARSGLEQMNQRISEAEGRLTQGNLDDRERRNLITRIPEWKRLRAGFQYKIVDKEGKFPGFKRFVIGGLVTFAAKAMAGNPGDPELAEAANADVAPKRPPRGALEARKWVTKPAAGSPSTSRSNPSGQTGAN